MGLLDPVTRKRRGIESGPSGCSGVRPCRRTKTTGWAPRSTLGRPEIEVRALRPPAASRSARRPLPHSQRHSLHRVKLRCRCRPYHQYECQSIPKLGGVNSTVPLENCNVAKVMTVLSEGRGLSRPDFFANTGNLPASPDRAPQVVHFRAVHSGRRFSVTESVPVNSVPSVQGVLKIVRRSSPEALGLERGRYRNHAGAGTAHLRSSTVP